VAHKPPACGRLGNYIVKMFLAVSALRERKREKRTDD